LIEKMCYYGNMIEFYQEQKERMKKLDELFIKIDKILGVDDKNEYE